MQRHDYLHLRRRLNLLSITNTAPAITIDINHDSTLIWRRPIIWKSFLFLCSDQNGSRNPAAETDLLTSWSSPLCYRSSPTPGWGRVRPPHQPSPSSSPAPLSSSWQTKWDYQRQSWEALHLTQSMEFFLQDGKSLSLAFWLKSINQKTYKCSQKSEKDTHARNIFSAYLWAFPGIYRRAS